MIICDTTTLAMSALKEKQVQITKIPQKVASQVDILSAALKEKIEDILNDAIEYAKEYDDQLASLFGYLYAQYLEKPDEKALILNLYIRELFDKPQYASGVTPERSMEIEELVEAGMTKYKSEFPTFLTYAIKLANNVKYQPETIAKVTEEQPKSPQGREPAGAGKNVPQQPNPQGRVRNKPKLIEID